MTPLTASVEQAARHLAAGSSPPSDWSPVYRALVPDVRTGGPSARGAASGSPAFQDPQQILRRQFCARALLVAAVSEGPSTVRLRIGLHPEGATLESSRDGAPSTWSEAPTEQVPPLLRDLLSPTGFSSGPVSLSVRRDSEGLRLTPEQGEQIRRQLLDGAPPQDAFAVATDLDPRLLDAFTASGPRASLSLTLHDPLGEAAPTPVTWSRLWMRGTLGLYRTDGTQAALGSVHPVADGDVLGTVLPILDEGLRFAAGCSVQGDFR